MNRIEVKYFDIGSVSEFKTEIMETENFDFSKEQIDNFISANKKGME